MTSQHRATTAPGNGPTPPVPPPAGVASDALVLFGATGDLARKKLFPALHALSCAGRLPRRVICVAATDFTDTDLADHITASVHTARGVTCDDVALRDLLDRVTLVAGDYRDPDTFIRLRRALDDVTRPLHYLAIPPSLFGLVVDSLAAASLNVGARVVVEKPFGRDTASAVELNETLHAHFHESAVMRIDHFLGKQTIEELLVLRFANALLEPVWSRNTVESVQITMAETLSAGESGRGAFYDSVGAVRDVVQNHLLEVLALLAMEPPDNLSSAALAAEKTKVLRAIAPLEPAEMVRGQYRRYRDEAGVDPESTTETYAALRLRVDNWRWDGVPFLIRTGKALPVTATEAVVTFKAPPRQLFPGMAGHNNAIRLRLGPTGHISLGLHRKAEEGLGAVPVELAVADRLRVRTTQDAYARLIGDALTGEDARFAHVDSVMQAWRIVDPVLSVEDVSLYESGTWGPRRAVDLAAGTSGWVDPV